MTHHGSVTRYGGMDAHGDINAQPLVTATNPLNAPFMAISIANLGSPVTRSSYHKLVNSAHIPPLAADNAVAISTQ